MFRAFGEGGEEARAHGKDRSRGYDGAKEGVWRRVKEEESRRRRRTEEEEEEEVGEGATSAEGRGGRFFRER